MRIREHVWRLATSRAVMQTMSRFRIEILPLKAGEGFFARLISLVTGVVVDGPAFPTDTDAMKWVEGRLGLRA